MRDPCWKTTSERWTNLREKNEVNIKLGRHDGVGHFFFFVLVIFFLFRFFLIMMNEHTGILYKKKKFLVQK